jgi:hypothetical protein
VLHIFTLLFPLPEVKAEPFPISVKYPALAFFAQGSSFEFLGLQLKGTANEQNLFGNPWLSPFDTTSCLRPKSSTPSNVRQHVFEAELQKFLCGTFRSTVCIVVYWSVIMESVKLIIMVGEKPLRFHQSKSVFPARVGMRLTTSSPRFKFKCQRCGVLKTQDGYSNKEINAYKDLLAKSPGMKPHPVESARKCRACNDSQLNELECQGPCGKVLPLGRFSKQQRKGGLGVCSQRTNQYGYGCNG